MYFTFLLPFLGSILSSIVTIIFGWNFKASGALQNFLFAFSSNLCSKQIHQFIPSIYLFKLNSDVNKVLVSLLIFLFKVYWQVKNKNLSLDGKLLMMPKLFQKNHDDEQIAWNLNKSVASNITHYEQRNFQVLYSFGFFYSRKNMDLFFVLHEFQLHFLQVNTLQSTMITIRVPLNGHIGKICH